MAMSWSLSIKNRSITHSPQNLYLPLLDLPQAIVAILDKINKVQARRRVWGVLWFKRIIRPNVIREGAWAVIDALSTPSFSSMRILLMTCVVTRAKTLRKNSLIAVQPSIVIGPATTVMLSFFLHPDSNRSWLLLSIPRTQRWRASATASRGLSAVSVTCRPLRRAKCTEGFLAKI